MIKVTLGKLKTQEEKPFPKLMKNKDGEIFFFVRRNYGLPLTDISDGRWPYHDKDFADFSTVASKHEFTDYNEPVTLQNV